MKTYGPKRIIINEQAKNGEIDEIIGRETEIKEIIFQRDAKWQLLDKQYFSKN